MREIGSPCPRCPPEAVGKVIKRKAEQIPISSYYDQGSDYHPTEVVVHHYVCDNKCAWPETEKS